LNGAGVGSTVETFVGVGGGDIGSTGLEGITISGNSLFVFGATGSVSAQLF
jgi:hypothetical protein